MILKRIHLVNFKKYEEASITLSNSLIGIFGNNGAGKSSLFEAVTWCLYGVAQSMEGREGVNQKDLIQDGKDEMGVEVEFLLGNHKYKVARYLNVKRGVKARVLIDGKVQARKSREVINRIEQDIGLNVKGFVSSSFIRQKELDLITSQIASKRQKLINRLFNLRVYEKYEEAAREKKKEKEAELKHIKIKMKEKEKDLDRLPQLEKMLQELKKTVSALKKKYEAIKNQSERVKEEYVSLEAQYKEYQKMQSALQVAKKDVENMKNTLAERKEELKKIQKAAERKESLDPEYKNFQILKEKVALLEPVKAEYDTKTNRMKNLGTEIEITRKNFEDRIKELKEEITKFEAEREELKESEPVLKDIREKIEKLSTIQEKIEEETQKIDKIKGKEAEILAEKAKHKSHIKDLEGDLKEIQSIGVGAPCPKCKRPLEKEHLEELLTRYNSEIAAHQKAKEKYDTKEEHLHDMRKELEKNLKEHKEREKDLQKLKREEQKYAKAEMKIEDIRKRLKESEAKIVETREKINKLKEREKEIEVLESEIKRLEFDPSEYERMKKGVEEKASIEKEIIRLNERISRKESIIESIQKAQQKLSVQEDNVDKIETALESAAHIPQRYQEMRTRKDEIVEKELKLLEEYTEKKTQYDERIRELERLQETEKELKEIKNQQKDVEDMIIVYSVLKDAFKQIPVQIQSRLRPRIRKETSELLNEVTEGKYPFIDLEKDYSLTVYYDGQYYPISRFSGGEKDLINVCLRVGISRLLVSLSSHKNFARIQSLFLDECFGSFDTERRKNLLAALNQLRKYFAQIVLITHIEEIKETLPEAFLVEELENGNSVIREFK